MVIKSSVDVVFHEPDYIRKISDVIFSPDTLGENEFVEIMGNLKFQQLEYFLKQKAWYINISGISMYTNIPLSKIELEGRRYYLYYNKSKENIIIIRRDYYNDVDEKEPAKLPKVIDEIKDIIRVKLGIPLRDRPYHSFPGDWGLFINYGIDVVNVDPAKLQWNESKAIIRDIELPYYYKLYENGNIRGALAFIHLSDLLDFFEKLIKKYFKKKEI